MKLNYSDLCDLASLQENIEDLVYIEQSDWEVDHKYQNRETIFMYNGKYYSFSESRSGSPFSGYEYNDYIYSKDKDDNIECDEVVKQKIITHHWVSPENIKETEYDLLQEKLNQAENLLGEAKDMLSNVHCYETDIYREILKYFNGEDEE